MSSERRSVALFSRELPVSILHLVRSAAGSYNYLCSLGGTAVFTHRPVGVVLLPIPHEKKD
jgi:hypothetical protein